MPAPPKPAKGSTADDRRAKRRARAAEERRVKALVRARDLRICRVPGCSRRDIEVAHVRPKGMGGDHGLRTVTSNLICLCVAHHRGPAPSVHSATLRIEGDCDGLVTVSVRAGGTWYALGRC